MTFQIFGLICLGFLLGSIPFSLLITRLLKQVDVRQYGDGNPGAANAFKAGGQLAGVLALLLDFFKGCLPVALASQTLPINDGWIIPVALAPVIGHAYSPWLGFKGGKAITTTFGIWTGLTTYRGPLLLGGLCALFLKSLKSSAWASILAFSTFMVVMAITDFNPNWMLIALLNFAIILHKHQPELDWPIELRRKN